MAAVVPADRQPDRDRQRAATHALVGMLAAADAAGLPPLSWTVDSCGAGLYGQTDSPADMTPRATLDAWAKHLGLRKGQTSAIGGRKQVRAVGVCPTDPEVLVEIMADIPRDLMTHPHTEEGDTLWNAEGTPWH